MLHLNTEKNEWKPPQVREQIIKRCIEEMRKNTPKEILYKAGLDELANNIYLMDEINLLPDTPSDLYDGINIEILNNLNCKKGALLLSSKNNRIAIKQIIKHSSKIFQKKLNDAQCQFIAYLINTYFICEDIENIFFSFSEKLSQLWNEEQVDILINQKDTKDKMEFVIICAKIEKTDVIYKKYLKRALIGYCRPELKLERAKELNKILFEDKEKINKKIEQSNKMRGNKWYEECNGITIEYPKTVDELCKNNVYMDDEPTLYLNNIIDCKMTILFMRRSDNIEQPYITIVVCNRENRYVLFETYGKNNRKLTEQEMKLINDYCDRHGILRNNYLQMEYNFGEIR